MDPSSGTRVDLSEVFDLHVSGLTQVGLETRPLGGVNEAMADVLAGRVAARVVLDPTLPEAVTLSGSAAIAAAV